MGMLVVTIVFINRGFSIPLILAVLFYGLVWPQLAYFWARKSANPKQAELRNLLIDCIVLGSWVSIMHFSLWPSLTLLLGVASMTILTGGFRLLIKGFLLVFIGYFIATLFMGFHFSIENDMLTCLVSAIGMLLYVVMTNFIAFRQTGVMIKLKKDVRIQKDRMEGLAAKLAKYLSPQVYGSIFSGEKEVKVETYRKKLTVFFSDVEGFTELTENMESEELTSLLNSYLNEMSEIALKFGGTIDKYIGDSIMIFFGDPETRGVKEDALACVMMAMEMRTCMNQLRQKWDTQGLSKPLRIRIGINTGFCTVGNFGSEDRLDYTIIGNQVNLASRLETNASTDEILISEETYLLIKDRIYCEKKDPMKVKGIAQPVQTFQVLDLIENRSKAKNHLKEVYKGFNLDIDLSQTNKEFAIASLKDAIAKLDSDG
jgi:class 3 adenylate cyclase